MRWGIGLLAPVLLVGGLVVGSAGSLVTADVGQVWMAAAARTDVLDRRRRGRDVRLLVREVDVAYDGVQVLDKVSIEAEAGEVVALLGTNGAGKSTLLRAIAGLVPAAKGAVILDGRDTTYAPAHEVAPRGVALVPGGWATFPSLTVGENLRAAGWAHRRDRAAGAERIEAALDTFPPLRDVLDEPAANLSGGQQHMLGMAMALLARPKLLLVDELSLGLAPSVVDTLAGAVRRLAAEDGTTVVVVDQSLDVALSLAERAYFLDKGRVMFEGRTADLLDRPDLLRSTFLGNALPADDRAARAERPVGRGRAPALEFVGVSRTFGGIKAVDDVTFAVTEGEVVGLIGPNGAGKSTLVDLASGFLPAEGGAVRLDGHDVTRLGASTRARRGLGRSFQQGRLFFGLTVETCIAVAVDRWAEVRDPLQPALFLPAAYDESLRVADRVDELTGLLGLDAYRRSFVHELSTGTRRVVELACVMALEPTVVLLDEPSSGLAQRESEALAPLLLRLRDDLGASLLLVEHDMALVTAVADRLVALDLGRVVAEGTPADVLAHPAVVTSYLGTASSAGNGGSAGNGTRARA
jgi:branched-chain amino acid transport system ATP-binding protein